jgi:hypothetical protein
MRNVLLGSGLLVVLAACDNTRGGVPTGAPHLSARTPSFTTAQACVPTFAAAGSNLAAGEGQNHVLVADLNRDGRLDVVLSVSTGIRIFLGDGAGGFAGGLVVAAGLEPTEVAAGDFDGNGTVDLAVANASSNDVTILLGDGAGGFAEAAASPVAAGQRSHGVEVGDFDHDGKLDLAVTNDYSFNVTVLMGDGTGAFAQPPGSPIPVGVYPAQLVVGDFNADGKQDFAVTNSGSASVSILLGDGTGGFAQAPGSPVAEITTPTGIAAGRLDGDGYLDLAVASDNDPNTVSVLLGNGTGGFTTRTPVASASPRAVVVGDFDGDGRADLAVANYLADNVTLFRGDGAGAFAEAPGFPIAVGARPADMRAGDFNGDGRLDLAVANTESNFASILLQTSGCGAGAADRLRTLIATVQGLGLRKGLATSLTAKLASALRSIETGRTAAACGQIRSFVQEVKAQPRGELAPAQAESLRSAAAQLLAGLGCPQGQDA